jgi:hypothetical protein
VSRSVLVATIEYRSAEDQLDRCRNTDTGMMTSRRRLIGVFVHGN